MALILVAPHIGRLPHLFFAGQCSYCCEFYDKVTNVVGECPQAPWGTPWMGKLCRF